MRWLDVGVQVMGFAITTAYAISQLDKYLGFLSFLLVYFVVGACQAISCAGWLLATRWKMVSVGRKVYLALLGFVALLVLPQISSNTDLAIAFTLVGTGVLAIYYFVLSVVEARREGRVSRLR